MIVHGEISNRIHLSQINSLARYQCKIENNKNYIYLLVYTSLSIRPKSENQFLMLISSHEVKENGYESEHHNKVLTLFSAPNYNGESNCGGIAR
ncbi:unnamed protein product [Rotaria sordida]|uniref:Uncharacterized protein n=1 Tax=Rotaria sordida TaxID=392033 RepID=A0A814S0B3_9BILA|nr:unnamed protein product [Rotaria sordida]CAF4171820.1 unnamed protein product [Rotaria sordida]